MSRNEAIENIIQYFKDNEETFNTCIEELDSWNGYLGDDRYYEMYELSDLLNDTPIETLLNMAYFGNDENIIIDKWGREHHESFNPNRNYFYFNGYGNLCSSDYKDYSAHLDSYAIEAMLENRQYIDSINDDIDLELLFDELESIEE